MRKTLRWRDWLHKYFRASLYARLLPYLRPWKISIAIVLLTMVAQVGISLVEPWSLQILIDNGLWGVPLPDWVCQTLPFLSPGNGVAIVVSAVVGGILVRLLGNGLDIVYDYFKSRVNCGINLRFQADLFQHLQRLS